MCNEIPTPSIKDYAIKCHSETNHKYGGYLPYQFHLEMVVGVNRMFRHLLAASARELVESGCWVHDIIEDTRQSYSDVKKVCGEEVAELAYALTNEKGRNRAERGGEKYYEGIRNTPYAPFIKLCDRIANIEYSKMTKSRMFDMYKEENEKFIQLISCEETVSYKEMFEYMERLFQPS